MTPLIDIIELLSFTLYKTINIYLNVRTDFHNVRMMSVQYQLPNGKIMFVL